MFQVFFTFFFFVKLCENFPNSATSCGKYEFACGSGQCLPFEQECDGRKDCDDGSDETTACTRLVCLPHHFKCAYGACVRSGAECDGNRDCFDNSDEMTHNCDNMISSQNCGKGNFTCKNGSCISQFLLCDGTSNCEDGSDEIFAYCNQIHCPMQFFRCSYGACINSEKICDDRFDCVDGSDESAIVCGPSQKQITASNRITVNSSDHIATINEFKTNEKSKCALPKHIQHGHYNLSKPSKSSRPGDFVDEFTVLSFHCDENFQLYPDIKYLVCEKGHWSQKVPQCKKTCNSLISKSVDISCSLNDSKVDCGKPVISDTIATMVCKQWYEPLSHLTYNTILCKNGSWSSTIINCVPACGQIVPKGTPLIVNGRAAKKGEFPWQVAIYEEEDNETFQICGGSLINPKVVISAAHCFTDYNGNKQAENKYIIAAGKYYRQFDDKNDYGIQFTKPEKIFVPDAYKGVNLNYAQDIAVVILEQAVTLTPFVQPICMDWSNEYESRQLVEGAIGEVAGWGYIKEGKTDTADSLRKLSVPFIDFNKCYESVPEDFRTFLTSDKFCAGHRNGSSVCQGDSGGGLAFKYQNRYFLRGIVSVGPQHESSCNSYEYGAYTKVSKYLDFISKLEVSYRP